MFDFLWPVAVNGYQWVSDDDEEKILPPEAVHRDDKQRWPRCHLEPIIYSFREYDPFENPALFRVLAETLPTPAGILAFANKYGHLGDKRQDFNPDLFSDEPTEEKARQEWEHDTERSLRLCDPIDLWVRQIDQIGRCVRKWDTVQQGPGDDQAIEKILREVNEKLTGDHFRIKFAKERSRPNAHTLLALPRSLGVALWMQLGQAIIANKIFQACSVCGKWYEISPPLQRKSRHYCTDACRSQAYRNRKELALRLAGEGISVKKIAKELDSTIRVVEGWLKS